MKNCYCCEEPINGRYRKDISVQGRISYLCVICSLEFNKEELTSSYVGGCNPSNADFQPDHIPFEYCSVCECIYKWNEPSENDKFRNVEGTNQKVPIPVIGKCSECAKDLKKN
jgi:hypothetical protein